MKDIFLVLASGSRYRAELLARLGIPFETWSPDIDETPLPGESCARTASRLARAKAEAGRTRFPHAWVIGSDQVPTSTGAPSASLATAMGRGRSCAPCAVAS